MSAIRNFFRGIPAAHRIVVLLVLIWVALVAILVIGR